MHSVESNSMTNNTANNKEALLYQILDKSMLQELHANFEPGFYLDNNEDLKSGKVDAFAHYMRLGWLEGRMAIPEGLINRCIPNSGYTRQDGCVLLSMYKPLLDRHFAKSLGISPRQYQMLVKRVLDDFDFDFYLGNLSFRLPPNIAIDHYLLMGIGKGLPAMAGAKGLIALKGLEQTLRTIAQGSVNEHGNRISQNKKSDIMHHAEGCCDSLYVGKNYALAIGWLVHDAPLDKVVLFNTLAAQPGNAQHILRMERVDVAAAHPAFANSHNSGFFILFHLDGVDLPEYGAETELHFYFNDGTLLKTPVSRFLRPTIAETGNILKYWNPGNLQHLALASEIFSSVLADIFAVDQPVVTSSHDFGHPPENPAVSIIIPLYGRVDFMQYQLSAFARDASLADVEIIYLLDDPSLRTQVWQLAAWAERVFGKAFRLLEPERNVGFARANNIAASHARGNHLLLMNSDVLPKQAGWLPTMLNHAARHPEMGLLGVRLLFEDGSLQHDGMVPMRLPEYPGLTLNDHPCKGWPLSLSPNAPVLAECELVTAACVLVKKAVFQEVGGFDQQYFLGDFEDSDLCRKLLQSGYRNYIARDLVLYHLERQSQNKVEPGDWKHKLTLVNATRYQSRLKTLFTAAGEISARIAL